MGNKTTYTVKEIAIKFKCADRTVRRHINNYVKLNNNGGFEVSEDLLKILQNDIKKAQARTDSGQDSDNVRTPLSELNTKYEIVEGFTSEEYSEFQKRLIEYPQMKEHIDTLLNQLEYMRKSGESKDRQMELLLHNLRERNSLEAKDKGLIN